MDEEAKFYYELTYYNKCLKSYMDSFRIYDIIYKFYKSIRFMIDNNRSYLFMGNNIISDMSILFDSSKVGNYTEAFRRIFILNVKYSITLGCDTSGYYIVITESNNIEITSYYINEEKLLGLAFHMIFNGAEELDFT